MKNDISKKVSIICPCYNHSRYVLDLLNSIVKQTYSNIEIIITDDYSNDNSFDKILSFKHMLLKKTDEVKLFKNSENLGVCKTINNMIKIATGYYIKIIASDDILKDDAIEKYVDFYEKNPSNLYICSEEEYIDMGEHYPVNKTYGKSSYNLDIVNANLLDKMYEKNLVSAPTAFFKKETFEKYGLYNEKLLIEDYPMWLELADKGTFGYINQALIYYRTGGSSFSRRLYAQKKEILNKYVYLYKYFIDTYESKIVNRSCKYNGTINNLYMMMVCSIYSLNFNNVICTLKYIIRFQKKYSINIIFLLLKKFIDKKMSRSRDASS